MESQGLGGAELINRDAVAELANGRVADQAMLCFPFILKQPLLLFAKAQVSDAAPSPPPHFLPSLMPPPLSLSFSPPFLSIKAKTTSQCMPVTLFGPY